MNGSISQETKPQNWNALLGREGYMALAVGVGDPGGDGESKLHWLQ